MTPSVVPTVVVVVGDGTSETAYYSDQPVRVIVVEPDLVTDQPSDAVNESIVFDLKDAELPSDLADHIEGLLNKKTA